VDIGYTQPDHRRGRAFHTDGWAWDTVMMRDAGAALEHVKSSGTGGIVGYCWGGNGIVDGGGAGLAG